MIRAKNRRKEEDVFLTSVRIILFHDWMSMWAFQWINFDSVCFWDFDGPAWCEIKKTLSIGARYLIKTEIKIIQLLDNYFRFFFFRDSEAMKSLWARKWSFYESLMFKHWICLKYYVIPILYQCEWPLLANYVKFRNNGDKNIWINQFVLIIELNSNWLKSYDPSNKWIYRYNLC